MTTPNEIQREETIAKRFERLLICIEMHCIGGFVVRDGMRTDVIALKTRIDNLEAEAEAREEKAINTTIDIITERWNRTMQSEKALDRGAILTDYQNRGKLE